MTIPKLLTKSDMATRWSVTRQVVNNWSKRHADFPPEVSRVDNGRLPLYLESDIEKYEKARDLV
ncbi:hypothetical protein [Bacillus mojavensis]|uniref:hypothetical protein n=1 Tax=Bacillus mojavensis TaxID=72360 RepID=UPI0022820C29|nr:hypothetical protein [Bacillus mojavensis]MCY9090923.1 hypothetical protein [Bacillus mojavensis]